MYKIPADKKEVAIEANRTKCHNEDIPKETELILHGDKLGSWEVKLHIPTSEMQYPSLVPDTDGCLNQAAQECQDKVE